MFIYFIGKRESRLWTACIALIKALIDNTENTSSLEKESLPKKLPLFTGKKKGLKGTKPVFLVGWYIVGW